MSDTDKHTHKNNVECAADGGFIIKKWKAILYTLEKTYAET